MLNKLKTIVALVILTLGLFGCKSKKDLDESERSDFSSLEYKTFSSSKATFNIVQGQSSFKVNGSIRIRKDSMIMISVQPFLGMEVARAILTNDNLVILDRFHKKYFTSTFEEMSNMIGIEVNYHIFQSILTNELFVYDKKAPKLSDFKEAKVMELTMLQYNKGKIVQEFTVDSKYRVQSASIMADGQSYSLRWNYSKFNALENGYFFPHQTGFSLNDGNHTNQLDIEYKKIDINKELNFDGTIPSSYTAVTFDELMNMMN
ncbi:MAG TPA: DUF4292 domain-containing protein [Paludibacteraceae bacterium]|jgi:hypothetical protein|nr:DUF4292 domain-containing protein [Paludibacteraceae bacterium]HQF49376.1 DUF4292 domain-containing protein [Paludibacteraceae bacterium]